MATVQTQYTTPESGWVRIQETDARLVYTGVWATESNAGNSGGTARYGMNGTIHFDFKGTQLRIIGGCYSSRATAVEVYIDGVLRGTMDNSTPSTITQVLLFSLTGLDDVDHHVEIINKESKNFMFDAIEINSDGALRAQMGSVLAQPEPGWKRYDNTDATIKYKDFTYSTRSGDYNGTISFNGNSTNYNIGEVRFKFRGTKLRIITPNGRTSRTPSADIYIDGNKDTMRCDYSGDYQVLSYEKLGLEDGEHEVIINNFAKPPGAFTNAFGLDAIDIDQDGRLIHLDEVFTIDELEVGKRIRAHYAATSNAVGSFSKLGEETSDFIPPGSSATPNGDFYFIMVDEGNGKKKLIADRNIQHTISWDTLNSEGIVNGNKLSYTALDPISKNSRMVLSNNNLVAKHTFNQSQEYYFGVRSVAGKSKGKWYLEVKAYGWDSASLAPGIRTSIGVVGKSDSLDTTTSSGSVIPSYFKRVLIGDESVYGVALDLDNKKMEIYQDGILVYTEENLADQDWYPASFTKNGTTVIFNFGQQKFVYDPPSNEYKAYDEIQKSSHNLTTRLLTGGISSTDKDNEWDNYIVNSTLGGTIIAGDNNVWNWSANASISSFTSTTSTSSGYRTLRGNNESVNKFSVLNYKTNNYAISWGFRPVLEIESLEAPPINKHFIYDEGQYKKWVTGETKVSNMIKEESYSEEGTLLHYSLSKYLTHIEIK